jgi:hypothetical protein
VIIDIAIILVLLVGLCLGTRWAEQDAEDADELER